MNKRVIALFACIAVLVALVVLGTAVFVIRDITVLSPISLAETNAKIANDSLIVRNMSIFALSEPKASKNIELNNPYVKVVDIERVFPSSVRIRVEQRTPIIALPIVESDNCVLLDSQMKILAVKPRSEVSGVSMISGYNLASITAENEGQFLLESDSGIKQLNRLSELIDSMYSYGFIGNRFASFVSSVDMDREDFIVLNTVYGARLAVRINTNLTFSDQFSGLYSYFCNHLQDKTDTKYIFYTDKGIAERTSLPPL